MPNNGGNNVNRPTRPRRTRSPLIAIAAVTLLLSVGAASAGASSSIEGIWSFNGGQIGVQRLANGTYSGTVVVETKFAECSHPVGQEIWTKMAEQPDGSYLGLHQWYFGGSACQENPLRGPTAWRVLEEVNGSHFLRVCFSNPGTPQPTIAANGAPNGPAEYAEHQVTYGCTNSSLTAPLPVAPGSGSGQGGAAGAQERLKLPSARKCLSARSFKIHLADPQYDPLKKVTVTLGGHKLRSRKIATSRRGNYIIATISLRGLPKGAFTIKIHATTVLGHTLSASRTYHTCDRKHKRAGKKH
jgi:hypothetical protein